MGLFDDQLALGSRPSGSPLERVPLDTWISREAALYALRMIQGQRLHGRLVGREGIRDAEILTLIGLAERSGGFDREVTASELRDACTEQHQRLEARFRCKPDGLSKNIDKLGLLLKLNATERAVLRVAVVVSRTSQFGDLFQLTHVSERDLLRGLHFATGCKLAHVREALSRERSLRRSGFLSSHHGVFGSWNPIALDDDIAQSLLAQRFNEERILRHLARVSPKATLSLADFSHVSDMDLVRRYLEESVARRKKGSNVLIYGEPGTGKTEFVRAIAEALGITLYEVPNSDSSGEPISGQKRFRAYGTTQHLLAGRRNQALLFDEVEDVFGGLEDPLGGLFGFSGGRGSGPDGLRKSWINETIESNPVPAIWVCNQINGIDHAYLRRFDLVMEFRTPTRRVRQRMVERHFKADELSAACVERLVAIESLTPALIERAARVVRTVRSGKVSIRDAEVERVVATSLGAMGCRVDFSASDLPEYYDPALLNTDRELGAIAQGLGQTKSARLCLYGPPGTGKTAFAHHLGRTLDRRVVVRRASDILNPYLGGTEANLRKAFDTARQEDAILLIDEADSFLQDRSGAHRQWEVTQVNELLTQMESFNGIFIASTNLIDRLDSASLRRFDFKVKFDYLTREQQRIMLGRIVDDKNDESGRWQEAIQRLDHLSQLTPGDFANVLRQLAVTGQQRSASRIIDLLSAEVALKPGACKTSIGFVRH